MARSIEALGRTAMAALQAGKLDEAERQFKEVLRQDPKNYTALNLIAIVLIRLERFADAESYLKSAVQFASANDATFSNYGIVLKNLNRPAEALKQFDRALAINASNHLTLNNRGTTLNDLKRYEEAIADFIKAIALKTDFAEAICNKGNSLSQLKRYDEAIEAYKKALQINSNLADARLGYGNVLASLRRYDDAFEAYNKTITIRPDIAEAWLSRANALSDLKRGEAALSDYNKALALKPKLAEAWLGGGNVYRDAKQYEAALKAYEKAFALKADLPLLEGSRLHSKMHLSNWRNFDAEYSHLFANLERGILAIHPFALQALSSSAAEQYRYNMLFNKSTYPPKQPNERFERYRHDRIKVAYLAADFRDHATSHLLAGVFEHHDRNRFETIAISFGPNDQSETRKRIEAAFELFIDMSTASDFDIAQKVRELEVDIAIDLMGYTGGNRMEVFTQRCAPVQVNYLAYPGTIGADYLDYLIADATLIPETSQGFYSEKIAYLPHSYAPTDAKRIISERVFNRAELGLPETGFVFCCFNQGYKITPDVFHAWMRILKKVSGGVLWLAENNPVVAANITREAAACGVGPECIVFAKRLPSIADHLARYKSADLFLDTRPSNAHTTASDCLWAGLPILTQIGESFAGRVASSLLNAVGLSELITTTQEEYEALAVDLGRNPMRLDEIKRKLAANRFTEALFDTKSYTRHIEAAFSAMYERHNSGLAPDHIRVAKQ